MDLLDTPEEAAFRQSVRSWFEEHLPADLRDPGLGGHGDVERLRAWSRTLHDGGWAGLAWPAEHGGRGLAPNFHAIFLEEESRVAAPPHLNLIALGMAGPTLISRGTPEQQSRYLPGMLTAEEIWCQGFSEPGAGSDLSAIQTTARLEGDRFVLDGQKVWSSFGDVADWCIILTRSDPGAQGREGMTFLILDMHAPGVEARPIRQMTGDAEFSELFLTGVEVPVENVVGEIGGGWDVAMTTLLHERGTLGLALVARLDVAFRRLLDLTRDRGASPTQRDAIAQMWIELEGLKDTASRSVSTLVRTGIPGPEGSGIKLHWSELNQRLTSLALELLGPDAVLGEANAPYAGFWQHAQLRSRGNTIEAGTSEILRNILAERVLGLPRSR
ncbi:MAG: acyl-CoA dehydrogenase [Actinobacteria bacterium]|nr:acyl-CoA dehydrogenase [Actinomycetota bacterium]